MADDAELIAPILSTDYGKRVLLDGRLAPELMVRFRCPNCGGEDIIDANRGVPLCPKDRGILKGISVIHPTRLNRVDQDERLVEPEGWVAPPVEPAPSDEEFFKGALFRTDTEIRGGPS